jgi:hypothetical protein
MKRIGKALKKRKRERGNGWRFLPPLQDQT